MYVGYSVFDCTSTSSTDPAWITAEMTAIVGYSQYPAENFLVFSQTETNFIHQFWATITFPSLIVTELTAGETFVIVSLL
jgi:hypothetical protein